MDGKRCELTSRPTAPKLPIPIPPISMSQQQTGDSGRISLDSVWKLIGTLHGPISAGSVGPSSDGVQAHLAKRVPK